MRVSIAVAVCLLASVPAFAGPPAHDPLLDQVIPLGSHTLAGGASVPLEVQIPPNNNPVVGFSVSFDYNDAADTFAWASDLRIAITPGFGAPYSIGGFSTVSDTQYSWFTNTDTNTGHFDSGPHYAWPAGIPKDGLWNFVLRNDYSFNGAVQWNNVTLTLHKTPEPTSLGLLGIGALALLRRRR